MLVAGLPPDQPPVEETGLPANAAPSAEPSEATAPPPPALTDEPPVFSLEDRVRRLEDVIAALQLASPEWIEATQANRITHEPSSTGISESVSTSAALADLAMSQLTDRPSYSSRHQPWLLLDIYAELRVLPRMFFDPRYRLTWHTCILAPILLVAIVLTKWTIGQIPLIGWVLDLIIFPVLLYVLFKVLSREATRYRSTSPDLPASYRL